MPTYRPLGGKSRRYLEIESGQEISRREYLKRTRGTSFEKIRDENLRKDPLASVLRPARGRKSAQKAEEKALIAQMRLEEKREKELRDKIEKERKRVERQIKKVVGKKVSRKKISKRLLKPGRLGARIVFNSYDEYLEALREMRALGENVVWGYGVGVVIANEETGEERDATLWTLQGIGETIGEEELWDVTTEFLESRAYKAQFARWFMHVRFAKSFALSKAKQYGIKIGGF